MHAVLLFKERMKFLKKKMNYKDIIAKSLQNNGPTAINMHKIENHFIMDIDYSVLVNAIVEDLKCNNFEIKDISL